jgi:hypothetical protein
MRRHPVTSVMKMTAAIIAGVRRTRQSRLTAHAQIPSHLCDEDDSCDYCRSEEDAANKQANNACADTQSAPCSSSTVCPECGKEARDINRHIR